LVHYAKTCNPADTWLASASPAIVGQTAPTTSHRFSTRLTTCNLRRLRFLRPPIYAMIVTEHLLCTMFKVIAVTGNALLAHTEPQTVWLPMNLYSLAKLRK